MYLTYRFVFAIVSKWRAWWFSIFQKSICLYIHLRTVCYHRVSEARCSVKRSDLFLKSFTLELVWFVCVSQWADKWIHKLVRMKSFFVCLVCVRIFHSIHHRSPRATPKATEDKTNFQGKSSVSMLSAMRMKHLRDNRVLNSTGNGFAEYE